MHPFTLGSRRAGTAGRTVTLPGVSSDKTDQAPTADEPSTAAGHASAAESNAYYVPLGEGNYLPTIHTEGAWTSAEQHMAPVSGLLTDAIETCSGRTDLITSRISFDILGLIRREPVTVTAEVIRPGRTIELVRAEMSQTGGRALVRAHGWRLAVSDTAELAGSELAPMPGPDEAEPWDASGTWGGGFIASLQMRVLPGWRPGRGRAWLRTDHPLVQDRPVGATARFLGLVDTANGVAVRAQPGELIFPNTDLTVHLIRQPRGEWLGLDTSVTSVPSGWG